MKRMLRWATSVMAVLVMSVVLVSCMREHSTAGGNRGEGMEVQVSLSMGIDPKEDFRLAQNIDQTLAPSTGNVAAGKTTTPAMSEKNLRIHLAVSRGGNVQYQTKEFKKVPGQNRATYNGQLTIPKDGTGEYKITAIVLSEVEGVEYARVNVENQKVTIVPAEGLLPAEGTIVNTKGPYLAETSFSLAEGAKSIRGLNLPFKPSGMLIRVQVQNQLSTEQTISKVKLKTNAFFTTWTYNLTDLSGGNLLKGETDNTATWEKEYTLPAPITLAPQAYSDYYYLWVMPRKKETGLLTAWTIEGRNVFDRSDTSTLPAALPEGQGRMLLVLTDATTDVCPADAFDYLNQFAGFAQENGSTPVLYKEQMFARSLNPQTIEDLKTLIVPQETELRFNIVSRRKEMVENCYEAGVYDGVWYDAECVEEETGNWLRNPDKTLDELKTKITEKYPTYHIPSMEEWGLIFPTTDPGQFNPLREEPALRTRVLEYWNTGKGEYPGGTRRDVVSNLDTYHPFMTEIYGESWSKTEAFPTRFMTNAFDLDKETIPEDPYQNKYLPYSLNPKSENYTTRVYDEKWTRFITDYFPIATSDTTTIFNFAGHVRRTKAVERVSFDGGATVEEVTSEYDFTPRHKNRTVQMSKYAGDPRYAGDYWGTTPWRAVSTSLTALRFSDNKSNCRRIAVRYEMLREIKPLLKSSSEDPHTLFENAIFVHEPGMKVDPDIPYLGYLQDRGQITPNYGYALRSDVNYMVVKIKKIGSDPTVQGVADLNDTHFANPDITLVFPARLHITPGVAVDYSNYQITPGNSYFVSNSDATGNPNFVTWAWGGIRAGSSCPGLGYYDGESFPVFLFHGAPKR